MRKKEIINELKEIKNKLSKLERLTVMILKEQEHERKTDSTELLNEYLMGDRRNEN